MSRHVRRWVDKLSDQNNKSDLEKKKIKIVRELCEKQNKTKQNKQNEVTQINTHNISKQRKPSTRSPKTLGVLPPLERGMAEETR